MDERCDVDRGLYPTMIPSPTVNYVLTCVWNFICIEEGRIEIFTSLEIKDI